MRPRFFSNYPTIRVKPDGDVKRITNLSRYVRSSNDILLDAYQYYDYTISGDERPDQVAFTEYGDTKFYWIVLVTNNIRNIWTEWPLGGQAFDSYIINKYGSISTAQSGTYRNIAYKDIYKPADVGAGKAELIIASGEPVSTTAISDYSLIGPSSSGAAGDGSDYITTTNYQREVDLNTEKRSIKLVRRERLGDLQNELMNLFGG